VLYTIEAAFGERAFAITEADNPRHIQIRTGTELWLKEKMINLAVARLPSDWKYVAWVDGDVRFARDDWADETVHQLQHYSFVQMWSQFQDLNNDQELIGTAGSFMDGYLSGRGSSRHDAGTPASGDRGAPRYPYPYPGRAGRGYPGAPGLAWACTRDAWNSVGGLLDTAILGASDWYMAHALVGRVDDIIRPDYHPGFQSGIRLWQARAERTIRRNVGLVKGLALHYWHGPKSARRYGTRDQILVDYQFNPCTDLYMDHHGLYQLSDDGSERAVKLRDGIRAYFRQRNEDALS